MTEDKELAMWDNFVLPNNIVDKVLELHRSPEIESGDCLAWSGLTSCYAQRYTCLQVSLRWEKAHG